MKGTMDRSLAVAALLFTTMMLDAPPLLAQEGGYFGFLRARDLTPFGFLRLDMRPTHAVSTGADDNWSIEMDLAYQNTWALSPEVEGYLNGLSGRRP